MGNHEFCEECGESSFHSGRPCNPEKKAAVDKANRKREQKEQAYRVKLEALLQRLIDDGVIKKDPIYQFSRVQSDHPILQIYGCELTTKQKHLGRERWDKRKAERAKKSSQKGC